jgi:hypothetical protein
MATTEGIRALLLASSETVHHKLAALQSAALAPQRLAHIRASKPRYRLKSQQKKQL